MQVKKPFTQRFLQQFLLDIVFDAVYDTQWYIMRWLYVLKESLIKKRKM